MQKDVDAYKKTIAEYPFAIPPIVAMAEANEAIKIYDGLFRLKCKGYEFEAKGEIVFKWFPIIRCYIAGKITHGPHGPISFSGKIEPFEIFIDATKFGESYISLGFLTNSSNYFEGSIYKSTKGDESIGVDKVRFAVPNLKQMGGSWIKAKKTEGIIAYPGRIELSDIDYRVILDQNPDFRDLEKSLNVAGGYIITYTGEIQKINSNLSYKQTEDIVFCLSIFLSFLNGSFTSPLFWTALDNDTPVWANYGSYRISPYRYTYVASWADYNTFQDIPNIWFAFSKLWKDENVKSVLIYAVRWYIEANSEAIYGESKTMVVQAALELVFNWYLIESKKNIIGKKAENIPAAGKLRLLLSHLKVDPQIPSTFTALQIEATQRKSIDGPDIFIQIRNAIVHSQLEKRKKLLKIDEEAKWQALQLGLWYLELSLLSILDHNGYYLNRITRVSELVPWHNTAIPQSLGSTE